MISGSCLCGAVAFEVAGFSSDIYKCHCSRCRKLTGGASCAAALAPEEAFSWLRGQDEIREFRLPGAEFTSRFCATCGSVVPQHVPAAGFYWVPAGLLDGDPGIPLSRHIHVDSKAPWEILDERCERLPEGFTP